MPSNASNCMVLKLSTAHRTNAKHSGVVLRFIRDQAQQNGAYIRIETERNLNISVPRRIE